MPSTTTLATLATRIAEELDIGLVMAAATGATTTITETGTGESELQGPFSGAKIPIGSPVSVITGGTVGEDSFVSNFSPSTGVVTLLPAITTGATGFIIWNPAAKHAKNIEKAISRGNQRCRRWMMVPLTYVPDGDMLGTTISDFWTASAGTASYVSPGVPEVAGQRVIQIQHSSAATLTSNTIPARAGERWVFETAIRADTDGDTATFSVQDITNSVAVTVSYNEGDGATTSRAFVTQRGSFTVPGTADTDARIAFRIAVSGSGTMEAQMAPIVAYPQDAMRFPLQQRVVSPEERVGNFRYSFSGGAGGGPDERYYSPPITLGGREHWFEDAGDHVYVNFNFQLVEPVYYKELVYGTSLTAMTDTTVSPADYVLLWAKAMVYDFLMRSEMEANRRADNGAPLPSVYRPLRNAAVRAAKYSEFEPKKMETVVGRR